MPELSELHQRLISCPVTGGRLLVNLAARRVFVNDDEVKLTDIEFRLLWQFIENPGIVLRLRELLSRVWGENYVTAINCLHVHIKKLRDKLRLQRDNGCSIRNIRGVGYRFDIPCSPAN